MPAQATAKVVVLGTDHPHVFALAEAARDGEKTELVGVYDADAAQRSTATDKLGVAGFASVDEALAAEPALVLIGAVPSERAKLAQAAVEAGAAVLVDKPLALNEAALTSLQSAVAQHGKPVIVYYPYRGDGLVLAARRAIEAGRIGKLVRIFAAGPHKLNAPTRPGWHWTRAGNGGALIDIGSHHADLCCWIAGASPTWLSATHDNFSQPDHPEFQDFAQGQMRFPDGTLAHLEVDWLNPASMKHFGDTRFWFQGTRGKIELRLGDEKSGYLWTNEVAQQPLTPAEIDMDAWTQQLVDDLATGQPPAIPQDEVWRTSRVTLSLFASAERGGEPITLT